VPRILLGKIGTDAHDTGVSIVARWLRDAGHEVIYLGLYNTPETIVTAAMQEDVRLIGISFLGGEPVYLSRRVREVMRAQGLEDVPLVVGGVITPDMTRELASIGVAAVFTPGARREVLLAEIANILNSKAATT
jgi:methylmalonyl-CoA mutase C-terminal domain/subunit